MQVTARHDIERGIPFFIYFSAFVIALTAITVVYGWISHNATLIQIRQNYSPMKFNTAICFLLISLAIASIQKGILGRSAILAAMAFAVPLSTLIEYALGTDFGSDNLFISPFIDSKVEYIGRMAPNTATGLALASGAILFYALRRKAWRHNELIIALVGSVVFSIGAVPLIGYMGGIESAHTWGKYGGMALPTSVCFIFIGSSIVAYAWNQSSSTPTWISVPVAIGFLIITISVWQALVSFEDILFEHNLQQEAEYIAGRSNDRLTAFYSALDRITDRWIATGGTSHDLWERDINNYLKDYTFLKAVEWVGDRSTKPWIIWRSDAPNPIDLQLITEATRTETEQLVITTHVPQVTKAINLPGIGKGFLYVNPLFIKGKSDGMLIYAYTPNDIFQRILMRDKNGPFYLTVSEGGDTIFKNAPEDYMPSERWQKSVIMQSKNHNWVITINPTPQMLASKNSAIPTLILITGLLTSLFATFAVLFAIRSRQDTKMVRASEDRLRQIIEVNSAIGAPDFNLQTFMRLVTERMQIITPATGVVIELVDGDEIFYAAASGTVASHVGMRMKQENSLSGLCISTGNILISDDTSNDPRVNAEACRKVGASSMVAVPLKQRGNVVGILKVLSTFTHAFTSQDIATLQIMVGLLGSALGQELEIERRTLLEEKLRYMAQFDTLTGLPNRALFKDRLSHAIFNSQRNGKPMAVIYMDIDHFKSINDKYGHAEGDELLKSFSKRVVSALRKGDTLARLGGDEFVAIIENLRSTGDAEQVAAKIVNAMQQDFELPTVKLKIGASLGVAISTKPDIDADEIVGRADEALYEIKRAGRNGFRIVTV